MHLPGFENFTEVGRGGFGVVYRAFQTALRRDVAIKVLAADRLDGTARQRFEREAAALGVLGGHPHVIAIHDAGFDGRGNPHLIMPFLTGGSLRERVEATGPLGVPEAVDLGVKLAGALETAHLQGVVHGDVKPDNILFDDYGEPQLCDFGIVTLLHGPGSSAGPAPVTVGFTAPEVIDGHPPTPRADVFGLATTLSAALRGGLPSESSPAGPNHDLRAEGVPEPLCEVLDYGMIPDLDGRAPTARAFGSALVEVQRRLDLPTTQLRTMAPLPRPGVGDGPWSDLRDSPTAQAATDPGPAASMGGPTVPRSAGLAAAPAPTSFDDDPATGGGRRRAVVLGLVLGLLVLAVGGGAAWWLVLREPDDLLAGSPPIFQRLDDPAGLVEALGDPASFDGQARVLGAWWSLSDWCRDSGWEEPAPCYDTAAALAGRLVGVDPRGLVLSGELDRVSVREGLVEGHTLTQTSLDRAPQRLEVEALVVARPGIALTCNPSCAAIAGEIAAEIAAAQPVTATPTPIPAPGATPGPSTTPSQTGPPTVAPLLTIPPASPATPAGRVGGHPSPTIGDWTVVLRSIRADADGLGIVDDVVARASNAAADLGLPTDRVTVVDTDTLEFGTGGPPSRGFYAVLVDGYDSRAAALTGVSAWQDAGFAGAYLRGPLTAR